MLSPKVSEKLQLTSVHSEVKFDRSNKFDFCYYGQVNSLRLKSSAASKWASKHLPLVVTIILLALVHKQRLEYGIKDNTLDC